MNISKTIKTLKFIKRKFGDIDIKVGGFDVKGKYSVVELSEKNMFITPAINSKRTILIENRSRGDENDN